mmetsp:Transcript_37197/g.104976  ORF Transcript_37197/g.104976 Transcript_37197/m.104976 type:complete len:432 (-) Transcript_37197:186-1481(-)
MAEDLTKGLNLLLLPKFTEIVQRIDQLETWYKELHDAVALKEERQEVDHLREHFDAQIHHVDKLVSLNKEKMTQLDELRSREIRALNGLVEQKATIANMSHLSDQVQSVNNAVSTKAENTKVDHLGKQLQTLSEHVALKSTNTRTDQLSKQLQALNEVVEQKTTISTTDRLHDKLMQIQGEVATKASIERMEDLNGLIQTLSEECGQKAHNTKAEQLHVQLNSLADDLSRRAEISTTDHLYRQMQAIHDEVVQKAESVVMDQTIKKVQSLGDAMAQKAETAKHNLLNEQFHKLREDVFNQKTEFQRVDDIFKKLETLNSIVRVDNAKIKNLCLKLPEAAATSGNKTQPGTAPSSAPTTAPNSAPNSAPSGDQKQLGYVTLPSVAPRTPSTVPTTTSSPTGPRHGSIPGGETPRKWGTTASGNAQSSHAAEF